MAVHHTVHAVILTLPLNYPRSYHRRLRLSVPWLALDQLARLDLFWSILTLDVSG